MTEEIRETRPKTSAVVTFLIGNGFDIGLGLKTKYADFVTAYLKQPSKTDVIVKLKKAINQDADFWGDAELAFGKLPFSTFGKDSHEVLKECIADFSGSLSDYLRRESQRLHMPGKNIQSLFPEYLCSYYQSLVDYAKLNELGRMKQFKVLTVNIINFNYTESIDKLLFSSDKMTLPGWGNVQVNFRPVCHVHGALSTRHTRLFGVNMASQITDAALSAASRRLLVKSDVDRMAGCGLERAAKHMIDESDTVIIFGMSLGETDKLWWEYLVQYLKYNENHRICLIPYLNNARAATSVVEEAEWAELERSQFCRAVGIQMENRGNPFSGIGEWVERIDVLTRGPHFDPDGHETFCDPFQLTWFGKKLVTDRPQSPASPSPSSSSSNP